MRKDKKLLVLLFLLITSTTCYANGIPAYVGTAIFHVVVINIIVIMVESFMLKNTGVKVLIGYIILANLLSLFIAYPFTDFFVHSLQIEQWFGLSKNGTIKQSTFLMGACIFIVLTILVESPFYYLAVRKQLRYGRALKYCTVINLITNIAIVLFYLLTDAFQPVSD